jgi:hypothetical protein
VAFLSRRQARGQAAHGDAANLCNEFDAVNLPPGIVQSAGSDSIETEFIDKLQDDGLGLCIVARNGQGPSPKGATVSGHTRSRRRQ